VSKLYFYEFCDYEGYFWAYSETEYTSDELEAIVKPRSNKYDAEMSAYDEISMALWKRKEDGKITEEEWNKQNDILMEEYPGTSDYGLKGYIAEHYNMVVLEHDAIVSASMGMW